LRRPQPVSQAELFAQLLVDVTVFTALLYLTGGATNPLVWFYLLPITIAAMVLTARQTWLLAAVTIVCYTVLLRYHVPLPHAHDGMSSFDLHVMGMWLGFVLSAGLIAFFIARMAQTLYRQTRALANARERAIRDQQLVTLGTIAASAAHELGTPLGTIALLSEELEEALRAAPESTLTTLSSLKQQVSRCKQALSNLSASAGSMPLTGGRELQVDRFIERLLHDWRELRPKVAAHTRWEGTDPVPLILAEQTLCQALLSILNNAADASPHDVQCDFKWDDAQLFMEVRDRGPGLTQGGEEKAGKIPFTTKPDGMGLGLLLAHGIIERFGGTVRLLNRAAGGLCTQVRLPLRAPAAGVHA
jgi:two-component system sensor histidine kinase RegB